MPDFFQLLSPTEFLYENFLSKSTLIRPSRVDCQGGHNNFGNAAKKTFEAIQNLFCFAYFLKRRFRGSVRE